MEWKVSINLMTAKNPRSWLVAVGDGGIKESKRKNNGNSPGFPLTGSPLKKKVTGPKAWEASFPDRDTPSGFPLLL